MDSRPMYEIVNDAKQLADTFERIQRDNSGGSHYILYQFGDRSIMIKMDVNPISAQFSYDDKEGRFTAPVGLRQAVVDFSERVFHQVLDIDNTNTAQAGLNLDAHLHNARQAGFKQHVESTETGNLSKPIERQSPEESIAVLAALNPGITITQTSSPKVSALNKLGLFHQPATLPPTPPNSPNPHTKKPGAR